MFFAKDMTHRSFICSQASVSRHRPEMRQPGTGLKSTGLFAQPPFFCYFCQPICFAMEKQVYEVPRVRVADIRLENVLLNPSDQLPPSEEWDGGDY